jgi:prepilin-type N-terminal cleavage/methylation domain-containing protein
MNMNITSRSKGQKGFTLVELAIVLVIAGLILTGVLKGTDAINKAKAERAVADLRGLQGMVLEYQKRTGHLPGDCNNDGIIGFYPVTTVLGVAPDATEANRILPTTALGDGTATANCATAAATENGIDVAWNDMRRNNIVDPQRLPAELAKNPNGSWYAIGNMTMAGGVNQANVIVIYNIPVWLAEAIDASIDGSVAYTGDTASTIFPANIGRIRRWDGVVTGGGAASDVFAAGTFINGFAKTGETRDSLIAISYQFDTSKLPN